jgi:hypothetical protein
MAIAQKNLEAMYAGEFKMGRKASKGDKVSRELKTEAMRLARITVKDAIVKSGEKISHVAVSDITAYAADLIATDPDYYAKAKENLENNKVKPKTKIDISGLVSPELVAKAKAKAEAAKAKSQDILSKTQAGLVKGRKKPMAEAVH